MPLVGEQMGFRQQEHFHTDMDTPNKEFATQPCAASGTAAGLQHGEQQPALCARGRMRPQHASSATAPPSEADLVSHTVTAPSGCLTASELLTLRKLSRCTPSCDLTCIAQNLFQAPDSAGVRVSAPEQPGIRLLPVGSVRSAGCASGIGAGVPAARVMPGLTATPAS